MRNTPQANHERSEILSKTRWQYEPGPMRHRLYEVFAFNGQKQETPSYEWMYYAGMGNVDLYESTPEQTEAIRELLKDGRLVPTFEDDFYGFKKLRLIQHFDDVKFGVDEKGDILIYDFAGRIDLADLPDPVIRPDAAHDAAIAKIRERMDFSVPSHAVTVDPAPLQLRGGPVIRPILTNADIIETRRRQRAFQIQ